MPHYMLYYGGLLSKKHTKPHAHGRIQVSLREITNIGTHSILGPNMSSIFHPMEAL